MSKTYTVRIFYIPSCYYSMLALEELQKVATSRNRMLLSFDVSQNKDEFKKLVRKKLKSETMHVTFPQIWIDDEYIGGYEDLIQRLDRP